MSWQLFTFNDFKIIAEKSALGVHRRVGESAGGNVSSAGLQELSSRIRSTRPPSAPARRKSMETLCENGIDGLGGVGGTSPVFGIDGLAGAGK